MARATIALLVAGCISTPPAAQAYQAQSTSYRLDQAVVDSFGGRGTSASYDLTSSGGEAFAGPAQSTNFQFNAGYVATLENAITLTLNASTVALPALAPGDISATAQTSIDVRTDAPGYLLWASQDHDLRHTDAVTTVPAISSGTVATPSAWTEATTMGFGFTLVSGTGLDPKWGVSPNFNFAAVPNAQTIIHTKSNYQNAIDTTIVRYRLKVPTAQKVGSYSNQLTFTATGRVT